MADAFGGGGCESGRRATTSDRTRQRTWALTPAGILRPRGPPPGGVADPLPVGSTWEPAPPPSDGDTRARRLQSVSRIASIRATASR